MWIMVLMFVLSCGADIKDIRGFQSEESCRDAIPKIRAGFVGLNPLIDCVKQ